MRRTDRLYALVEELRARSPRPVPRAVLAERLEVTPRTVERDILALQQAGVPIWSERGRSGGYVLDSRWTVPPLNLDATEVLAVVAALATAKSLPFAEAGRRAERKLLGSMVPAEAVKAKRLADRMRAESVASPVHPRVLRTVEEAIVERRVVDLTYAARDGRLSRRMVEPHELHLSADASYLVGWCRLREEARSFRLDRIVSIRATDDVAPDRELDVEWLGEKVEPMGGEMMPTKKQASWGPPRKADHRTGANPAFARAIAGGLPGVKVTNRKGRSVFTIEGERFAAVDDDETLQVGGDTVLLNRIGRDDVRSMIEEAWSSVAPKRLVSQLARRTKARAGRPGMTQDDVRQIVLALPDANEGPIWGKDVGFRVGEEKRGRFARFGPPAGGRVSNLLPPDDENTLVLLRCPQRPALLASCPERYFTTPHYGAPDEPGGVIVRLDEFRTDEERQELAELLEDAWADAGGRWPD